MLNWKSKKYTNEEPSNDEPRIISIEKSSNMEAIPQGNKIYFYSDVTKESILNLNRQIDDITKQMKMIQFMYNLSESPRIELHISSDGGDVFSVMSAVDKIITNPVIIDTYCEGMVASAGTLLSVVGTKRYISKHSCMLIHQVTSGLWGNYMEFKDEIKNLDLLMTLIKGVYLNKTKFQENELNDILSHDLYLSADNCLKHGLVDFVI